MSFQTIENDIKNGVIGKAAPVLLFGEEHFLTDHYEKRLEELFGGGAQNELDVSVFYGDDASDDEIMGALDTFPMLSPARIVIVRNHPGFSSAPAGVDSGGKTKKGLADYVSRLPDTARLIFTAGGVNKTRALYKAVSKHGTVYEFARLREEELKKFARKRFKALNSEIPPDVLEAFVFATGYLEKDTDCDLFTVENDVCKIATFAKSEGRAQIAHSDVDECLPGVLRTDVFGMLDAISSGRKGEAIGLLENSLAGGESAFRLLSLFIGQFEIMLGCKELGAAGHPPAKITQILGERSDWRVKKLGGFAQRFDTEKLKFILGELYGLERQIKSGDIAERLALTLLLVRV
ncbi:MAG: DNA polymerase III subunit delta [Clostridiales Family XIII bacterium]|jgi:DNA polymerase-3 subunit delta|nr:DNA polymerase III subunit delta [Clostridiales Family XIII bacterium]